MEYIPSWKYHKKMTRNPYPSEVQDRFIVRLPNGMREKIAEIAKANGRSMNAEIVARLEQSFKGQEGDALKSIDRFITALDEKGINALLKGLENYKKIIKQES